MRFKSILLCLMLAGLCGSVPSRAATYEVHSGEDLFGVLGSLQAGDEASIYSLYFPICALIALQLQGGLDGFILVERYLLQRRGLFPNQVHRGPLGYAIDDMMCAEIDRLFEQLQDALGRIRQD